MSKRKALTPAQVQGDVSAIRDTLLKQHSTYIDAKAKSIDGFSSQVQQVYKELTGNVFPKSGALEAARQAHLYHHGRLAELP